MSHFTQEVSTHSERSTDVVRLSAVGSTVVQLFSVEGRGAYVSLGLAAAGWLSPLVPLSQRPPEAILPRHVDFASPSTSEQPPTPSQFPR